MAKEKYYLYIDESGWRYPDKEQASREDGMDYFALGGILVKNSDRNKIIKNYEDFCKLWNIDYPLHSTKIRGKRGSFNWLKDDVVNEKFSKELMEFMCSIPVMGFAVIIDRNGYNRRYKDKHAGQPWLMCKTAFCILIERVSKYMDSQGRRFKIILEQCGKREDQMVIDYFRELRQQGMPFDIGSSSKYGPGETELFKQVPYGDPEFHTKKSPLLQIADFYLYPMVKGAYYKDFFTYKELFDCGKIINSVLTEEEIMTLGIKRSCFDAGTD